MLEVGKAEGPLSSRELIPWENEALLPDFCLSNSNNIPGESECNLKHGEIPR